MDLIKTLTRTVTNNAPVILTSVGVVGVFTTAFFAGKASIEAYEIVKDVEGRHGVAGDLKTRVKERVSMTWKCYIPPVLIGATTVACIVGAHSVHTRRAAALMSVYTLTETALKEYRNKVVETIGENKEQKIRDSIAQDKVRNNPPNKTEVIITGNGDVLCLETITGRYFTSTHDKIMKAQNEINFRILNEMYASHNDFCQLVGLPDTLLGDQIGWTTDNQMDIEFSSALTPDDQPCLAITYSMNPKSDYYKIYK